MLGDIWQCVVQMCVQCCYAVHVIIRACENGSAAGRANGICHVAMIQTHAFIGQAIDIWRGIYTMSVGAYRLGSIVICHNENNIRSVHWYALTTVKFGT